MELLQLSDTRYYYRGYNIKILTTGTAQAWCAHKPNTQADNLAEIVLKIDEILGGNNV